MAQPDEAKDVCCTGSVFHLMNKNADTIYLPFTFIFHFLQLLFFKYIMLWIPLLICFPTFIFLFLSKSV